MARKWVLDARIADTSVGVGLATDLHACLKKVPAEPLSSILIGGMGRGELPIPEAGVVVPMLLAQDFLLPPLPNTIYIRDSSC